ncbi:MAG: cellulase family glycosylhydrolase [Pseudomonadota bacterium]
MNTLKNFKPLAKPLVLGIVLSLLGVSGAQAYQVNNSKIYDEAGQRIPLRGINWFGFETATHAPHGLWARNADDMITQMKSLGINAVRVPIAPNTLRGDAISGVDFALNPNLVGKNGLQTLDYIIAKLDEAGIYILLDHHHPDDFAISELWYTDAYSEAQWIADLEFMADRYKNVPHFFAIDLKNEPHGRVTWGTGNQATDWNLAAERASQAVLAKNPNLVVFVAGIDEQATCSSAHAHGWGGNLEPLRCMPLNIPANKLVLTPHFYGPDVYMYSYFSAPDFPANMPAIWNTNFGFARDLGYAVVPTEFGSRYGHDGGLELDKVWFDAAIDWMVQKDLRDGFFWSWNPNSSNTGGLLQNDWSSVWSDKLAKLYALWGYNGQNPQPEPTPGDTLPPVLQSGNISGNRLVLVYNEILNSGSVPSAGQFIVQIAQQNVAVQSVQLENSSVILTLAGSAQYGQSVTLDYSGQTLKDQANNPAAVFTGLVVTNNASAPAPEPTPNPGQLTGDELRVSRHVDFDWSAGYCVTYTVKNTASRAGTWQTSFGFIDRLDNAWSASVSVDGTSILASGEAWNAVLQPGQETSYGYCATRPVVAPGAGSGQGTVQTQVTTLADWGTGYCSAVRVTNSGTEVSSWSVSLPMQGVLSSSWSARVQAAQGTLNAVGEDWNAYLQPGASTEFGFCANR